MHSAANQATDPGSLACDTPTMITHPPDVDEFRLICWPQANESLAPPAIEA